jgi:hypothetical protein
MGRGGGGVVESGSLRDSESGPEGLPDARHQRDGRGGSRIQGFKVAQPIGA